MPALIPYKWSSSWKCFKELDIMGRGGGVKVSALACNFDDPS